MPFTDCAERSARTLPGTSQPKILFIIQFTGLKNQVHALTDLFFFPFQGVGDNSQGFTNFVLFCLFTDKIKEKFKLGCDSIKPYCFRIPNKNQLFDSQSTNFPLNATSDLSSYGAGDFVTLTAYSV